MQHALERHARAEAWVIPLLLRPTFLKDAPFQHLQFLPTDGIPLTRWHDLDEAFHDIITGIDTTIQAILHQKKTKDEYLQEGNALRDLKQSEQALAAYEHAIRLDPSLAIAYYDMSLILKDLKRHKEAEQAHQKARELGYP